MKPRTVLLGLGLVGAMLAVSRIKAQQTRRQPVAVALVESLSSPTLRAEILRFADPTRPDLILLRTGRATSGDLATALVSYRAIANRAPRRAGVVAKLGASAEVDAGAIARVRSRAARMLAQIRREPLTRVGPYGRGRWRTFAVKVDD